MSQIEKIKVRVTWDIELPVSSDNEAYRFDNKAFVTQTVFDNLTNYVLLSHLQDARRWMAKNNDPKGADNIAKLHNTWADILEANPASIEIVPT